MQKQVKRICCVYKNIALMPVKVQRAKSLVRNGRAIFVKDKKLGIYLRLKEKPSGFETQKLALGIDYGTMWDGYSVVNEKNSHNFELEHTRKLKDRDFIKKKTSDKAEAKRVRRSRLWHREARFSNRTGTKKTYTQNYYFQEIQNMVESICRLYPISHIVIEDVASVHNEDTKNVGFSPLEQIKTRLYNYCSSKAELVVSKNNPKKIRLFQNSLFKTNGTIRFYDMKTKDKSEKSFYAHCIDSHSLACLVFGEHLPYTEEMIYISRRLSGIDNIRRKLERERKAGYKGNCPVHGLSKLRKIRVKIDDNQGNHGPWNYQYTERQITYSKKRCIYGSTVNLKTKISKYRENIKERFEYYELQFIKPSKISNHLSHYLSYTLPKEVACQIKKTD